MVVADNAKAAAFFPAAPLKSARLAYDLAYPRRDNPRADLPRSSLDSYEAVKDCRVPSRSISCRQWLRTWESSG